MSNLKSRVRALLCISASAVVVAAAAGCVASTTPLASYEPVDSYGASLLSGKVTITDGCLFIASASADQVPVFPKGSAEWDGSKLRFGGKQYPVGAVIELGGAIIADGVKLKGQQVPSQCGNRALWAVAPS